MFIYFSILFKVEGRLASSKARSLPLRTQPFHHFSSSASPPLLSASPPPPPPPPCPRCRKTAESHCQLDNVSIHSTLIRSIQSAA